MVVRGCQDCLKQHNKDEAQIESCDISFLFGIPGAQQPGENSDGDDGDEEDEENEDGEEEESDSEDEDDGDVDKDVIFRFKDGSWFIVQMFVDADDKYPLYDSWESFPTSNRTSRRTDSEEAFAVAQSWINTCRSSAHEDCKPPRQRPSLPTRLLDVQGLDENRVVVVETGKSVKDSKIDYLCLSHCWGPSAQMVKTTRANIQQHCTQGLELASLPQSFRDAVWVTRKLGFRYIWIDSLCIVQDDEADWFGEAAKMAQVYSGAVVTLAATKSSSGSGGLFTDTPMLELTGKSAISNELYTVLFRERIDHHLENLPSLQLGPRSLDLFRATLDRHPLLTRAWVFQERLLSTRVLHFGPYELFFECRTHVQCECGGIRFTGSSQDVPNAETKLLYTNAMATYSVRKSVPEEKGGGFWADHWMARVWRTMVTNYTALSLTEPEDRLLAIGGLALDMSRHRAGDDYLAGLWRNTLLDDLVWSVSSSATIEASRHPRPRTKKAPQTLCAPTWSWASVGWDTMYLDEVMAWDTFAWIVLGRVRLPQHMARVIDCSVVLSKGGGPFGLVTEGKLTLEGIVAEGVFDPNTAGTNKNRDCAVLFSERNIVCTFHCDYLLSAPGPDQVLPSDPVVCLCLGVYGEEGFLQQISLVLRKKANSNSYERIGFLDLNTDSPLASMEDGIYEKAPTKVLVIE